MGAEGNVTPTFIHVAGTNGKGSVCAMLDSILRVAGYRTGLYTSPHLVDFRERIRVNGEQIPEAEIARILSEMRHATEGWTHSPTFFELATVLGLRHFADAKVDWVVLETGMGGRLDSTNAVNPVVSVLTPIAMDHAQWLGDTIQKIAAEKAGILKAGIPAVSATQTPEAAAVLEARALEVDAPLRFVDRPLEVTVGLRGSHQKNNAALAVAALEEVGLLVPRSAIAEGLVNVWWPGRFQRLGHYVLDGGHNSHAAAQLVKTWREEFGEEQALVIFGALADKDFAEMLAILSPIVGDLWIVPVRSARSADVEILAASSPIPARKFARLEEALSEATQQSRRVLISGSLFLVGEAMELLNREGDEAGCERDQLFLQ
jgi:dihydrofolate synthase/folylpolyglutamate synthase